MSSAEVQQQATCDHQYDFTANAQHLLPNRKNSKCCCNKC